MSQGFLWLAAQSIVGKGVGMIGQIIIAAILDQGDFGIVALAYTFSTIAALLQRTGVREILIQRQQEFSRWVNPAFWLSIASGIAAAAFIAVSAPVAAAIYHDRQVIGILWILAPAAFLDTASIVPMAKLNLDMRFRAMAVLNLSTLTLTTILTIAFALLGFGAYSFVLPRPIVALVQLVGAFILEPIPIKMDPQFDQWRYMLTDTVLLFLNAAFGIIMGYGDYFFLGLYHNKKVVGAYFFAFTLSLQFVQLLGTNLNTILFPAFSRMGNDPARQLSGFIRSCRLLTFLVMPLCFLQIVAAGPLLHLLYGSKWDAAIPVLQALSFGMGFLVLSGPVTSVLQAQGRFQLLATFTFICAVVFLASVWASSKFGDALTVGIAVSIFNTVFNVIGLYVAIHVTGGRLKFLADILVTPLLLSALAVGIPAFVTLSLAPANVVVRLVILVVGTLVLYPALAWLVDRSDLLTMRDQLAPMFTKLSLFKRTPPVALESGPNE